MAAVCGTAVVVTVGDMVAVVLQLVDVVRQGMGWSLRVGCMVRRKMSC